MDGQVVRTASNPATLRLDEVLDIGLATTASGLRLPVNGTGVVPFTLVNRGNGQEAFALAATLADIDGPIGGFAVYVDGNGAFDPAVDRLLGGTGDVSTDLLPPGGTVALLLLVAPIRVGTQAHVTIAAHASTGYGRPGTLFAGRGEGGGDAVVGATTAAASIDLGVAADTGAVTGEPVATLIKSQSVFAPDGSEQPKPGAVITYTLVATFSGADPAPGAVVNDPIPDRTRYVPGSLMLDGEPLSDAADDDAGGVDAGGVQVVLGSVRAPSTHTIRFQVTIK